MKLPEVFTRIPRLVRRPKLDPFGAPGAYVEAQANGGYQPNELNAAADRFYVAVTEHSGRHESAIATLAEQPPVDVARAFMAVLMRTEGYSRDSWGCEFIREIRTVYRHGFDPDREKAFCEGLTASLTQSPDALPQSVAAALMAAAEYNDGTGSVLRHEPGVILFGDDGTAPAPDETAADTGIL